MDESTKAIIRDWARTWPNVNRVFIFGSVARGDPNPSDLDIAVEVTPGPGDGSPTAAWFDSDSYVPKLKEALSGLPYELDVQPVDFDSDDIVGPGVERDGILIYQR